MTLWTPRLPEDDGPLYRRIADALERDVAAGMLVSGSQLPTHRDLARVLGITAVTVTRAYAEAARRGLVEAAMGRGTFVRAVRRDANVATDVDLSVNIVNVPIPTPTAATLQRMTAMLSTNYGVGAGSERHRAAGAAWIGRRTDPADVLVTAGGQHAMLLAFAATTRPGDTILAESVTYHGAKALASLLHLKLAPLPLDRYGIVPDAFEKAARAKTAKVLYTSPTLQNPTGSVMPEKRRRELAAIAAKHGITIIEDDVCGFLAPGVAPLASFAPDRTIFLTGLGKVIGATLRVGYMTAPEPLLTKLRDALAASILFTSPVLAELAASWIEDGTAARLAQTKREEIELRMRVARRIFGKRIGPSDPRSLHVWIELPRRWTADAFVEEARKRRVRVAGASSFAVGDDVPRAIRVSIGAPASVAELESALRVVASIDETAKETIV